MGYRFLGDYEPQKGKKKNGAQTAPRSGNSVNPFAVNQKKPSAQATGAAQTVQNVRTSRGTALGGSAVTPVQMLKPTAPKLTKVSTPVQKTTQVQGQQLKLPNIQAFGAGDYSRAGKTLDRAAKAVKAGALNSAAGFTEIAAQFHPTTGEQSMGQFSGFGDLGRAVRENREKGTDINASIRQQEEQRRAQRKQSQQKMFAAADRLTEKGQQYEQEAKRGLGTVGQFLVDMGVTGTQMAGDAIANLVLPGSGLAMMGMRSYGQAAGEARKAGKSEQQQFLAGLKSAGIEVFTEKMFGAFSKVYGGAAADELIEKLVGKMTGNVTGQALLTWMINGVGEGVEEVTSDLLNPLADRLLGLDDGTGPIWSVDDLAQWGYDFLLGTAMGIVGGGTQLARGVQQGRAQTAESRYYDDLLRNGLGSAAAAENARRASDAMGRVMPARDGLRMPQLTTYEQRQAAETSRQRAATRYTAEEAAAKRKDARTFRNIIAGIDTSVSDFFERWKSGRKSHLGEKLEQLYIAPMPDNMAEEVSRIVGYHVDSRDFIVTSDDVKHVIDQHGNPAAEIAKGNIPLETWMLDALPDVVTNPDSIEPGNLGTGNKNAGKRGIVFSKAFPGGKIITIQFDNKGRGTLELNTMYAKESATLEGNGTDVPNTFTPEAAKPALSYAEKTRTSRYAMPSTQESAAPAINAQNGPPQSFSLKTSVPQAQESVNRLKMPQLVDEQGRTYEERVAWQQIPETQRAVFDEAQRIAQRFGARVVVSQQEGVNGSYRDGVISLNPNAVNPVRQTLIHELTHHMERSGLYGEFRDMALRYVAENMGADVNSVRQAVMADYARNGVALDEDGATREIVAKFAEEKLFTDETTVRRLLAEDRNLFQRIYDWIRDMAGRLTGTSEESFLRSAERLYAKALRETTAETGRGTQMLFAGENARTVFAGDNGTAYDINPFRRKAAQLSAIQQSNPFDPSLGAHTWIRSEGDILTYQEAIDNFGGVDDVTPDFRAQDVQVALDSGYVTVYSSYPIEQGTFVTPSRMEAQSYAGEGRVYSKQVPLSDVAWLDEVQGQYTGPVGQEQYSTGRGLDDLAGSSDYLDALARDENMFTSDAYTLADRLYDLQLRRAQQQEAPPERPAEQAAREDLDEIAELFTDQGNFFASREDRIRETENMVTDHTIEVGKSGKEKATEAWSYFYRKMVDAGHSVDKFAKAVGDPYLYQIYNQARASSSAGVSMITDAQANVNAQKVGESLNGVFSPIRAKGEDYYRAFQLYMFDLHNIDRMSLSQNKEAAVLEATAALNEFDANHPEMRTSTEAQLARMTESLDPDVAELARERMQLLRNINKADAIKDKPVFSFDVTADVSQERARRAVQEHPEFEQYRQQVRTYIDNLMQYRVDSGLMTQADADYLKQLYPNYVPTMRKGGEQAGTGRDRNAVRIGRTVGRAEGGTADLVPLHEALGRQTMKVVREGSKNRFGQRLLDDFVRVGENSPAARYVQEAHEYEHEFTPDTLDDMSREQLTKDKTLTVFKDGKLWELTVDDTMFDALKALSPDAAESNAVTRTIRTANNLFKALVTGYNPTFTIRNTVRDLQTAGLYTRDAVAFARNYPKALAEIKNNGEYWQMYKALGGSFSSVFDYNTGTVKEPKGRTAKLMAKIEALNMAMEQAPRLAEFMGVVEKGGTSTENLADALYAAADVTVNFGRSGTLGKVLNANYVPFLNPGIQGFDKLIRRVTETKGGREWAKLAVRAVALGVAPTLLNALLYHDDDEWDDLRDSDKDTNYLFKLGNGTWLKIPKGRELSLLGITADRIGDVIRGDNVDLIATINTMGNQVAPANPLTSNIASALFEAQLFDPSSPGRTWYGGDIENQRLQSYAPGQRYDSSTDIFSKAVGGALGISPKKLNYVLDQYSGVVGDFLLPLLTPQAERGMFSKAFTVDAVTSNRLSGDFYDESDALTYAKNGGDETAAVVSRFWSKQQSACSDLYKQIREVEASNLSDREKRQKTRELKALVNGIQKNAMAVEDTYRAAVEKNLQKGMDTDDAYRTANKDCFGAEYALQVYSKDVFEKAKNAKSNGVSYDDYYTYYFGTKGLKATDDTSVTTQKFAFLQSSGMDLTSQAEIYFADMASDKVLQTQAELEISSGITAEQFYQYKVVSSGMTKKAEKMQAINSLNLTSAQKDAIYYAEGWARSTIGQAPWRGGYSGGYTASGSGGNPFTRARTGSNPFLRTSGAANTGGTAQNPFTRARSQNNGQTVQSNPFLRARGNG